MTLRLTGSVTLPTRGEIAEASLLQERGVEDSITRERVLRRSDLLLGLRETSRSSLCPFSEGAAMPFVNKIEARAFARATEVLERVTASVQSIFPEHLKHNLVMSKSKAAGQSGDTIFIIAATLEGQRECDAVLDHILKQMDSTSHRGIERSLDIRLDDECIFFLRIDKQAAFLGNMKMADVADVISVRFHFRQHPRCRREEVMHSIEDRLRAAEGVV
jgi:RNA binding exosome subunit